MAQTGLATLLLLAAGLVVRSFRDLYRLDAGFDRERLISAALPVFGERYAEVAANHRVFERVIEEIEALPGVASAAGVLIRPLEGSDGYDYPFHIEGRGDEYGENPSVNYQAVTPGYFDALGIERLSGRGLEASDDAEAPGVVAVSRSFAERFFAGEDPVGHRLRWGPPAWSGPWMTVVGVVEDASYRAIELARSFDEADIRREQRA